MTPATAPATSPRVPRSRRRRIALWTALVALLVVAQSLLVFLTFNYERVRAQDEVEAAATAAAADLRQALARHQQSLLALPWAGPGAMPWRPDGLALLHARRELLRIERRDSTQSLVEALDSPYQAAIFSHIARTDLQLEMQLACTNAQHLAAPVFSRSYFVPQPSGSGAEVIDLCVPLQAAGRPEGFFVATLALPRVLEEAVGGATGRLHELSFVEGDGTRLARAGAPRGSGVFVAERIIDLPGQALQLRLDSGSRRPSLIPNLAVALVLGLSLAFAVVVGLLVRDVRRRAAAEAQLAEAFAFRKAMEDSLVTGLRARDLAGRITYANPAFCEMVGFGVAELMTPATPPYWPPELAEGYAQRQQQRLRLNHPSSAQESRAGFETVFMRRNGERFPVLIFEAPLVDGSGTHTGWMSAVLDISAQRRIEEFSRQQQERLQATARLATVGEMASLLSHELNQPLAAIASYSAGSLNLLKDGPLDREAELLLRQATERIAEQAERAGRVIKSVHDFVRRRDHVREALGIDLLFDAVLPLVRLQARKSATRIVLDLPEPTPRVLCDRTMIEQVLLNLARNGIQAMEADTPAAERQLTLRARQTHERWVTVSVIDRGVGVSDAVAKQLFTPFFTTRSEGMGLGLSLCRTVIEQHGGALDFSNRSNEAGTNEGGGTEFRFTLPAATGPRGAREERSAADLADTMPR